MKVIKHHFVIEEYVNIGWFKNKYEWLAMQEVVHTDFSITLTRRRSYNTKLEAVTYLKNIATPLPEKEIIKVINKK